jgi:hypothetical protein
LARPLVAAAGLALLAVTARAEEPVAAWEFSTSVYGYAVPDSQDYVNPNFTADHGRLHLEARYNYEAIDSGSVWAGANFSAGTSWVFDATLMLGGVVGDLEGIAPGYRLNLEHAWFGLASEGEYFIDAHDSEQNYLYNWTEAWGSPTDWFRAGIAVQRTRAYSSDLSVQRGVFVGFTYKRFDLAAYVFNLGWEDPTYVVAARFTF